MLFFLDVVLFRYLLAIWELIRDSGKKQFSCTKCAYKANNKGALARHIMTTIRARKSFSCDKCNYKTADARSISKHLKTDTVEIPHGNIVSLCALVQHLPYLAVIVQTCEECWLSTIAVYSCRERVEGVGGDQGQQAPHTVTPINKLKNVL